MKLSLRNLFKTTVKDGVNDRNRVVGIDIGTSSIKVVELEQRDDYVALATYGELQLGPYVEQELGKAVEVTTKVKIQALIDVLREASVEAKHAVVAIPLSTGFVTIVPMSNVTDSTLDGRVKVEARKYVPVPLKEISLEWVELPPVSTVKNSDENTKTVLIVAVHNDSYAEMTTMLGAVELNSQPTEIELFCLQRITNDENDLSAVIDFGADATRLYIFHEGYARKIHRVATGSVAVTKALATMANVTFAEAEALKHNSADASHDELQRQAIAQTYDRALREIERALQFYEKTAGVTIATVQLTGGNTSSPIFQSTIAAKLGRQCTVMNGFEKVAYPAFMEDTLKEIAPSFSVAIGAALRQLM